jgi:hypothetical protein
MAHIDISARNDGKELRKFSSSKNSGALANASTSLRRITGF